MLDGFFLRALFVSDSLSSELSLFGLVFLISFAGLFGSGVVGLKFFELDVSVLCFDDGLGFLLFLFVKFEQPI